MDSLRWGVLSTANIGRAAVNPAIQASANGTLVAVASRDGGRARAFAEAAGIPRSHDSYEALIDDPEVDAIYNPLPNSLHREWTMRALERGKHVLCEKPLGVSAAECMEMDAAAKAGGALLMEAFMYRFHPRIDRILEITRSGGIGVVNAIRSAFTFRLTRMENIRWSAELGGGALMDVGCYCVNISRTITGAEPVEAVAWAEWADTNVDAKLAGMLRFENGVIAQFDCGMLMERRELAEVAGTEGYLSVDSAFLPGKGEVDIRIRRGHDDVSSETIAGADEYRLMVEHFADCVLNGAEPRYPVADAAANMRAIEALYRSARSGGKPVEVEGG